MAIEFFVIIVIFLKDFMGTAHIVHIIQKIMNKKADNFNLITN